MGQKEHVVWGGGCRDNGLVKCYTVEQKQIWIKFCVISVCTNRTRLLQITFFKAIIFWHVLPNALIINSYPLAGIVGPMGCLRVSDEKNWSNSRRETHRIGGLGQNLRDTVCNIRVFFFYPKSQCILHLFVIGFPLLNLCIFFVLFPYSERCKERNFCWSSFTGFQN
jgi:hypothetical protein